jgi:hypothetical protein
MEWDSSSTQQSEPDSLFYPQPLFGAALEVVMILETPGIK